MNDFLLGLDLVVVRPQVLRLRLVKPLSRSRHSTSERNFFCWNLPGKVPDLVLGINRDIQLLEFGHGFRVASLVRQGDGPVFSVGKLVVHVTSATLLLVEAVLPLASR